MYTHLEDALLTLCNTPSVSVEETPTEDSRWRVQVSASATKTRIVDILNEKAESSTVPEADGAKNEAHARLLFEPYVILHSRLAKYKRTELDPGKNIPFAKQVARFYENRMLLLRLCEEQLHLIQRNSDREGDCKGSKAWELLFEVFRFHRQSFAEMKEPSDSTHTPTSYAGKVKENKGLPSYADKVKWNKRGN